MSQWILRSLLLLLDLMVYLKQGAVDCVILDRNLPDISGDLVLKWVRKTAASQYCVDFNQ